MQMMGMQMQQKSKDEKPVEKKKAKMTPFSKRHIRTLEEMLPPLFEVPIGGGGDTKDANDANDTKISGPSDADVARLNGLVNKMRQAVQEPITSGFGGDFFNQIPDAFKMDLSSYLYDLEKDESDGSDADDSNSSNKDKKVDEKKSDTAAV